MTDKLEGNVDIDSRIDYRTFYDRYLDKFVVSGDDATARCPVCEGKSTTALSINLKRGTYKCHKCDAKGNVWTFLPWSQGMNEDDAKDEVKKLAGIVELGTRSKSAKRAKITLAGYAQEKSLPIDFLKDLGLKDQRGNLAITIPYLDEAGITIVTRKRHPKGAGQRFTWVAGAKGKIIPYGVWRLREIGSRPIALFEGESDCHTLWHRGHDAALGIPGAQMMKPEWYRDYLAMAEEILIHVEPGEGGQKFLAKTCAVLAECNYPGIVKAFSTRGAKDPSDLHIAEAAKGEQDDFATKWQASLDSAQRINPADYATQNDSAITLPGAPVSLRMPEGFSVSASGGVRMMVESKGDVGEVVVCPVPVLISRRLRSIDTGEEKVELAYQRDGAWHSITTRRSVAFSSRSIIELADRGLPVTSETARHLVRYLGSLEAINLDTLPLVRSVERMGWVGATKFLPHHAGEVLLDPPAGSEHMADAYHMNGSLDEWMAQASDVREAWPIARFLLAAAFAAPMLRDVRGRTFLVHVWGQSRGGKTAALKLALSAWGEPEALMATFNATAVALERMAGFYNDLPMGVDERQVVSGGRGGQGAIEGLVYLIGAGKGRARGAKAGGMQQTQTWRTIALTSGEEPLSSSSSHTGVTTRAVEVYGTPIGDEQVARRVHRTVADNYGLAGPAFIGKLLAHKTLAEDYTRMVAEITKLASDHAQSHVDAIALVCLADGYLSRWIFEQTSEQAATGALDLARAILGTVDTMTESDYTGRAVEWLEQWLAGNRARFEQDAIEPYGFERHGVYWINPKDLEVAMEAHGFKVRRVLKDLADRGRVERDMSGEKPRLKVRQTWRSNRVWMIGYRPERDEAMQAELECEYVPTALRRDLE